MNPLQPRSVSLATGVRLAYVQHGEGEALLFLHGYTDSWFSFHRLLPRMPEGVRLLMPTQRGHGDSERPAGGYRVEDFAADAAAFLEALEVERACVVGHSMGSFVAQELALTHPERVSRLVLIGSALTADNPVVRELHAAVQTLEDPIDRSFVHDFQSSTLYRPIPEAMLEAFVDESMKVPARVWKAALSGLLTYGTGERLRGLRMPVLVCWGDRDGLFDRSTQDALLERLPGATLKVYAETGHDPHWEQPDAVARDLLAFMGQRPPVLPPRTERSDANAGTDSAP